HCSRNYPDMPVAMITAFGNMEIGVTALKNGAFDVVAKPLDTKQLRELATSALRLSRVTKGISDQHLGLIIGESESAEQLRTTIRKIARTQAPVFIHGEYGTGKESVARAIHYQSSRSDAPFIVVSCDSLASENGEERLLGSAESYGLRSQGYLQEAAGGTLFLSNIEKLPAELQARLLRVITEKKLRRPGAEKDEDTDVRIISSSSADPEKLTVSGELRQDLFFRLKVVNVEVSPLRQRREDIPLLVTHLLSKYAHDWDMPEVTASSEAMEALLAHNFPANLRELDSILQRAFTLMEGEQIEISDLQFETPKVQHGQQSHNEALGDLEGYLERLEREAIEEALNATRWNKTAAAERLGISFRALRYRCKKLAID
ncbi:MAG: sigma-54 dependent transcriptional regulator, partial [Thalassolituus sp.]